MIHRPPPAHNKQGTPTTSVRQCLGGGRQFFQPSLVPPSPPPSLPAQPRGVKGQGLPREQGRAQPLAPSPKAAPDGALIMLGGESSVLAALLDKQGSRASLPEGNQQIPAIFPKPNLRTGLSYLKSTIITSGTLPKSLPAHPAAQNPFCMASLDASRKKKTKTL